MEIISWCHGRCTLKALDVVINLSKVNKGVVSSEIFHNSPAGIYFNIIDDSNKGMESRKYSGGKFNSKFRCKIKNIQSIQHRNQDVPEHFCDTQTR